MVFSWFGKKNKNDKKDKAELSKQKAEEDLLKQDAEKKEDVPNTSDQDISGHDNKAGIIENDKNELPLVSGQEISGLSKKDDKPQPTGFFKRLKKGLSRTREILSTDIDKLFTGKKKIDDDLLEELEELLITADIGIQASIDFIDSISKKASQISDAAQLKGVLKEEILSLLNTSKKQCPENILEKPHVIMVVGVNGVGKTTTIGKLAARAVASKKKVLIAAADTFRAAAVEQLVIWAQRAGAGIVKHKDGADPAAVAYDGIEAAMARDVDFVLVDTAGRLHTKINLMEELKKIKRTISKRLSGAPHEILLVLDATTGQNALAQAKLFNDALGITGIAITKLDGTARGGIVVSICSALETPLKYIGVGEQIEDLQNFDPIQFTEALF